MRDKPIAGEIKLNANLEARAGIIRFYDIHRAREMGGYILTPHDPCRVDILVLDEEVEELYIYRH